MGANLSSTFEPDTSKDITSPTDRFANMLLMGLWIGAIYGMGMIWTTFALVDRWRGPQDRVRQGAGSSIVALMIALVWPPVLLYLLVSSR